MKAKIVCFKFSRTVKICILIILLQIGFIIFQIKELREVQSFNQIQESANEMQAKNDEKSIKQIKLEESTNQKEESIKNVDNEFVNIAKAASKENKIKESETKQENNLKESETKQENNLKEYETMPSQKKGLKIIGKITIPKLKLDTYILEQTTTKALKVSVTKLYGPSINEVGNFCIAGHNYRNNKMFGGIKKLENKDKIILTDTYGRSVTYEVYENYQTNPKDVSSLSQETGGDRELTLITCTAGAIKRVIVKAIEVYD